MKYKLFQIDAFTDKLFGGNPACVVPLDAWLPDDLLLKIAKENAVAETAFFVIKHEKISLRWFTPEIEMDLCGHATLAAAHCLKTYLGYTSDEITFDSLSGALTVRVEGELYKLNFPARVPVPCALPPIVSRSFNIQPQEVLKARDYVLIYDNETEIRDIVIDRHLFDQINLDPGGVIVTAKGESCDFVSRYFTPQASILEDPVTGSAHCSLVPLWSSRLHKNNLYAMQVSERTGILYCENMGERVIIGGKAKTYLTGEFRTD